MELLEDAAAVVAVDVAIVVGAIEGPPDKWTASERVLEFAAWAVAGVDAAAVAV